MTARNRSAPQATEAYYAQNTDAPARASGEGPAATAQFFATLKERIAKLDACAREERLQALSAEVVARPAAHILYVLGEARRYARALLDLELATAPDAETPNAALFNAITHERAHQQVFIRTLERSLWAPLGESADRAAHNDAPRESRDDQGAA